jgi:hypothetical protein
MLAHVLYDEMTIVIFGVVKHYWYSIVFGIFSCLPLSYRNCEPSPYTRL